MFSPSGRPLDGASKQHLVSPSCWRGAGAIIREGATAVRSEPAAPAQARGCACAQQPQRYRKKRQTAHGLGGEEAGGEAQRKMPEETLNELPATADRWPAAALAPYGAVGLRPAFMPPPMTPPRPRANEADSGRPLSPRSDGSGREVPLPEARSRLVEPRAEGGGASRPKRPCAGWQSGWRSGWQSGWQSQD